MREVMVELKQLRLHGMAAAWGDPPMATSNSPTCGHPKFPQARRLDYEVSGLMAMRVAASLRR
jgi:hypothetical protein